MHRDSLAERLLKAERGLRTFKPAGAAASSFEPAVEAAAHAMHAAREQIGGIILGKERQIRLTLACVLARGHLLIEDLPGVGKTTLAHAIARSLGLQFQRIQFTSDLLPADIIGVSIFDRQHGGFRFHPGPIFAQMILADEVNRATPKAQSALLEAMEEQQVTTEGETRPLPQPFFVIATQNPSHQIGTFPLPESQLDRFLMCIQLGYPDTQAERRLLEGSDRRDMVTSLPPRLGPEQLLTLQQATRALHVAPALLRLPASAARPQPGGARIRHRAEPACGIERAACRSCLGVAGWPQLRDPRGHPGGAAQRHRPSPAAHRRAAQRRRRRGRDPSPGPGPHSLTIPFPDDRARMPALRDQIADWLLRRRPPETAPIRLTQRRIYILPTSGGLLLAMTLLLMLMGCINYNLGLGYVLTFLLAGIGLVSILHTFRNLAQLELRPGRADPVFAGEQAIYPVLVDNPTALSRIAVAMLPVHTLLGETNAAFCDPAPFAQTRCDVRIPTHRRGRMRLPRLRVFTTYPLGLFHAWSYVELDSSCLIYPKPEAGAVPLPPPRGGEAEGSHSGQGQDDFIGLRRYAPGDSLRQVAWKVVRPRPAHHDQTVQRAGSRRAVVELVRSTR